jgi:hypothetical protein
VRKILFVLLLVTGHWSLITDGAHAAALRKVATPRQGVRDPSDFVSPYNYNIMYPGMNDAMRTTLNPGTTPVFQGNSVSTLTRTDNTGNRRRVVPRASARSATVGQTVARSAAGAPQINQQSAAQPRRVVARRNARSATPADGRLNNNIVRLTPLNNTAAAETEPKSVSTTRCLADYTACMDM